MLASFVQLIHVNSNWNVNRQDTKKHEVAIPRSLLEQNTIHIETRDHSGSIGYQNKKHQGELANECHYVKIKDGYHEYAESTEKE